MSVIRILIIGFVILVVTLSCSSSDPGTNSPPTKVLSTPTGISIGEGNQSSTIKWRAVAQADSYEIYIDTQQNSLNADQRSVDFQLINDSRERCQFKLVVKCGQYSTP